MTLERRLFSGADTGFQARGGGGALKKIAPSGGRREHFGGISCEKSRFYAKKSYFFPGAPPSESAPASSCYTEMSSKSCVNNVHFSVTKGVALLN